MKKIIVLAVLIAVFSISSFSQNTSFGVTAGVALASQKGKHQGETQKSDSKAGITIGVLANVPVADNIGFQPALNFIQKGGKFKESGSGYSFEGKHTLNYIELLLNMLYNTPAGKGKFFVGLGPALAYGIGGKYKDKTTFGGQTTEEKGDINFGNDETNDDLKPFEFAGNVFGGYEFSCGVFVILTYYLAFSNIALYGDETIKNRYFAIRIGYMLSGLMKK